MGWWNAENNLEVGDATLDLIRQFLNDFSREYQEDKEEVHHHVRY